MQITVRRNFEFLKEDSEHFQQQNFAFCFLHAVCYVKQCCESVRIYSGSGYDFLRVQDPDPENPTSIIFYVGTFLENTIPNLVIVVSDQGPSVRIRIRLIFLSPDRQKSRSGKSGSMTDGSGFIKSGLAKNRIHPDPEHCYNDNKSKRTTRNHF